MMNAANDSVRVIGIGRVRDDPKALELNFTGRPSDDDMRRIHDLLRDGPAGNDDALWDMLVRQAHGRLGIGPDPGESPFDYLQRALQRVRPYGVTASVEGPPHVADIAAKLREFGVGELDLNREQWEAIFATVQHFASGVLASDCCLERSGEPFRAECWKAGQCEHPAGVTAPEGKTK